MALSESEFRYVSDLVLERAGIVLEAKEYLIEERLGLLSQNEGLRGIAELVHRLQAGKSRELEQRVLEAMATNETSFFRDERAFQLLAESILPGLLHRAGGGAVRIWSACCASGQEAYSVAILLRERLHQPEPARVQIVASDLSEAMIRRAREGVYSGFEVRRGLRTDLLYRYFKPRGISWQAAPDLAAMIDFRVANILDPQPAMLYMDLVLLRNVLIYFSRQARRRALENVHASLRSGGCLILGGSETINEAPDLFETVSDESTVHFRARPAGERSSG